MNLDNETFENWCAEEMKRDPILYKAAMIKRQNGLSDVEFLHLLVYTYQDALKSTQDAFKNHLDRCAQPGVIHLK